MRAHSSKHFLLACLLPANVAATDAAVDEIFVTASRRESSMAEVSSALSVVTADEVRGRKLITDALDWLPGARLQQTTPGQGAVIIRGLKGSSILHLVDGMRVSNAMFRSAPTQYLALVPVMAVDHIEVLRGTSASLYGSEAIGGTVLVVSRLPEFGQGAGGEAQVMLDTAELQRSLGVVMDYGSDALAALFSAEYLETGDRRTGGGQRIGPSAYTAKAVRSALRVAGDDDAEWQLDLQFLEQPRTPRVDELVPGFGQAEPSSSEYFFAPNQRLFARAGYRSPTAANGIAWRADLAWQRIVDDNVSRDFNDNERRYEDNRSDLTGLAIDVTGNHRGVRWVAGFDAHHDVVHSARRSENLDDGLLTTVTPRYPDGASIDQAALFGKADWEPAADLLLSTGLRYTTVNIDVPDTGAVAATTIDFGRASGDLGILWNVNAAWQLLANVGFGFRAPNIFDLGTLGNRPGNRFNIPNTALDAESVTQADLGFRFDNGRLRIEAMLFALRYEDRITSVLTGDVTAGGRDIVQSENAARSSIRGAEFGFSALFTARLRLQGAFNVTRGEDREDGGSAEPSDRIPPAGGRVALTFDASDRWAVEGWVEAAARQDRLSSRDVQDIRIDPDGTPGWASIGASTSLNPTPDWQVQFGIDNLFDRRYRQHGSGVDAPGRNFWLGINYLW